LIADYLNGGWRDDHLIFVSLILLIKIVSRL